MNRAKETVTELLKAADIEINGNRPWDIKVLNENLYRRVLSQSALGLGESYMDGWWEVERLDQFFDKLGKADLRASLKYKPTVVWGYVWQTIFNFLSTKAKAFKVGEEHYDLGNDLYKIMLDKRMVYTCGYWQEANNLDEAQKNKLDLVCRKVGLKKGMRVLDIGCGWGSFAKYAAENYGVEVVGITVSKKQVKLARENVAGLPIEIRLQDYRDLNEKFDAIVSLGMFEHVGQKNYKTYMKVVERNLKDNGLFLLHTIGRNYSVLAGDRWTEKYIFPNSMIPSIKQIGKAIERVFVMEDWHNFGRDYDKTLLSWFENFDKGWPELKEKYGDRFYRMWKYFLLYSAGGFRSGHLQLWQIVLSKKGLEGGYRSIR